MTVTFKRATLADVANLAGVSLGSASRALSVPEEVKPKTLEKVNQAVAQLGYVRNGAAQALASKKTKTIAVIYPSLDNPIFASSVNSLQMSLWQRGYQLLIASHNYDWDREAIVAQSMVEKGIDGLILVGTEHHPSVYEVLRRRQIPYVLTWSKDLTDYPYCVGFSNETAAYNLAKLVLSKGHRKIAICSGDFLHNERAKARVQGTLRACTEFGVDVPKEYIIEQALSVNGGREGLKKIWTLAQKPSVIIFGNDAQAIGAIDESHRLGIRIPEDLSVTGFDDIELASLVYPPLTTIRVPINEIGTLAAQMMIDLIQHPSYAHDKNKNYSLTAEVIERQSLGDAK